MNDRQGMVMSEYIKDEVYDEINKDLHKSFEFSLNYPSNKEIAWATFSELKLTFYSPKLSELKQPEEHKLVNLIDSEVKNYLKVNLKRIDFSTRISASESMELLIESIMDNKTKLTRYYNDSDDHEKNHFIFIAILVMVYRELALIAYSKSHYYLAMSYKNMSMSYYSNLIHKSVYGMENFGHKLTAVNKEKANNRWSKHNQTRPEKKKLYLEIMDQQNFTTFTETAEYIKQHIETDKKPSYDTIKRWLSEASKDDFS